MELNTGIMGYPMPTMRNFQSKAEALQFAIEFTASTSMGGRKADLEAAKELYDFICKNVELPDTPNIATISVEEVIDSFPPLRKRYVRLWKIQSCNAWIAELADQNGDVVMLEDGTPLRFGKPNNTALEALFSLRKYLLDNNELCGN